MVLSKEVKKMRQRNIVSWERADIWIRGEREKFLKGEHVLYV